MNGFDINAWQFITRSILPGLDVSVIDLLTKNQKIEHFKKGKSVFREGRSPSKVHLILSGKVKKFKQSNARDEHIIYISGPGEFIGYHAVIAHSRYADSAVALQECEIACIALSDFFGALNSSEEMKDRLLRALSHEFTVMTNNLYFLSKRSVRDRLVLSLTLLYETFRSDFSTSIVEIIISRADLAAMVGAAKENVVRELMHLKNAGLLSTSGQKITVTDIKPLVRRMQ